MNREDYLNLLSDELSELPDDRKENIIKDYEGFFDKESNKGKSEKEIIEDLGNVKKIGKQYILSYRAEENRTSKKREKKDSSKTLFTILRFCILAFINLVFVIWIFFAVVGTMIGMYAAAGSIVIAGIGVTVSSLVLPLFFEYLNWGIEIPIILFSGIALTSFGVLWVIINVIFTKYIYIFTVKYIKWNVETIK